MTSRLAAIHKPCYFPAMKITSASGAIDALGGTAKVAQMFGLSYRVVSNWRSRGLPPDTFAVLSPALQAHGHTFSPLLFGQKLLAGQALIYRRGKPTRERSTNP
jgi:hypothetical protein